MESKQEKLLSRVVVNHLFLSQFEAFRALLGTLYDVNPGVALGILKAVIRSGGKIEGVLWSESVPSPAHLAWLCLGELTALQSERQGCFRQEEASLWFNDPRLIFDKVEFLLFVELLEKVSKTGTVSLTNESGDQLWETGRLTFRNFGRALADQAAIIPVQSKKGKGTSDVRQISHSSDETRSRCNGAKMQSEEGGTSEGGEKTKGTAAPPEEDVQIQRGGDDDLKKAATEFFQELSAIGLDRMKDRLRASDIQPDPPRNEQGRGGEDAGVSGTDGTGEARVAERHREATRRSGVESRARSSFIKEDDEVGIMLEDKHRTWVRKLALYHPDLLHALCTNIKRQRFRKAPLPGSPHQSYSPYFRRRQYLEGPALSRSEEEELDQSGSESSSAIRPGYQKDDPGQKEVSDEHVQEEEFKLGDGLMNEVQTAHVEQMKEDMRAGKLARAIQHLRYLRDGSGMPDSLYRETIRMVIEGTKKNVDPRRSPRDRRDDASIYKAHEQVIASGSSHLASTTESILDDLVSEAAVEMKAAGEQALPPALEKLHKRLETRRAVASTNYVRPESAWIDTCKMELFQYCRVMQKHALKTVMKAAFNSIKALQFQKAADVLASYPRLQPLATVMGWDLLAGKTSARRRLMEVLWAGRLKTGRTEGSSSRGRPAEEVSCIDELCDQLCYRLEVAYFTALTNTGGKWKAGTSKIFGTSKGQATKSQEDQPPAENFVANLVLERLAMHSPVGVIFDLVPNISFRDTLQLVQMQPVGVSDGAFVRRQQDIELVRLSFGVRAAVRALGFLEASAVEDKREQFHKRARSLLHELRQHLEAISTPMRKVWMMQTIVHLLYVDDLSAANEGSALLRDDPENYSGGSSTFSDGDKPTALAFVSDILSLLRHCFSSLGLEIQQESKGKQRQQAGGTLGAGQSQSQGGIKIPSIPESVCNVWERKAYSVRDFVEDWEWRLEVLQRLRPSSQHQWQWKEALGVLQASPSTLLNMCVQGAQYDLGEEAVRRYNLPTAEIATLQLAEWMDGAIISRSSSDSSPRVADEASTSDEGLNLFGLSVSLSPLTSVILFLDAAAASAKSVGKARQLLDRARVLLSQISPAGSRRQSASPIEQKQEAAFIRIAKQILQRFQDLVEQDKSKALQTTFSGADIVSSGIDVVRQGPKQRALGILHQIIEDAHNGKRQFLSGKLHNLVKALSDEEDDTGSKPVSSYSDRKQMAMENGLVLGLGFQTATSQASPLARSGSGDQGEASTPSGTKSVGKRFLGPLGNKPTAYLSAFILYIATVGDIVDGADTTHDFNYFSLIYERPNDLLTRLVFERGNADAAGKVAEVMGQDLVHQVITACVPPVYPPVKGEGWARIPLLTSHDVQSTGKFQSSSGLPAGALGDDQTELYVLQQDVVKHLVTLSPVRAILACVFGTSRFTVRVSEGKAPDSISLSAEQQSQQQLDNDQWFYEFALEQSERFPTLHRWIQIQANLQRLSESTVTKRLDESGLKIEAKRRSKKRMRDPDHEETTDVVDDQEVEGFQDNNPKGPSMLDKQDGLASLPGGREGTQRSEKAPPRSSLFIAPDEGFPYSILLDWENEGPYVEAVKGLMEEGKLVDALAFADRYLHSGAPDQLLQLLIEKGEDSASHSESPWHTLGSSHHNLSNSSWQYCVRLRNKELAATLALKYFHRWELDAAIDVLTMCSCHLDPKNALYDEVIRVKKSLQQYGEILRADSRFTDWREVEADCQRDPEGLALRLASKGAVLAALGVAESFKLPNVTRRELQGRQLVQLLTSDPTTGGGPAAGLKFLKSLPNPEDALPVAMAAMEQLPNLRSKQLLVHFFLKGRVGSLSEEEYARLDRLAIGLRMLGALPLPWQQRCSALHEHPRLILETLLMWKQLKAASQLLQAFPSLRDDDLIISYAAKAINFSSSPPVERRTYTVAAANKPPPQTKSSFTSGITSLHRRAFSWTGGRDSSSKPKAAPITKQKAGSQDKLSPSQIADWKAMAGIPEDSPAVSSSGSSHECHERPTPVTMGDEWVLTGDSSKDDAARSSHRYESAPSAILFKALLTLCSEETVAAKAAVNLCITEIQKLLKSEQLPQNASSEIIERGFQATEAFVQVLVHANSQLRHIISEKRASPASTVPSDSADEASNEGKLIFADYSTAEKLSELLATADMWLNRVGLLQSLLGSGVAASLDDLLDDESAVKLRNRLIEEERYNTAVDTCTKCKIDALPVWEAWGLALLRIEHLAQARQKFKQAFLLRKGDPALLVHSIMQTMESGPPADVKNVRELYLLMSKNFASSSDDSMSADAYLNVLCLPSFTKPRSRRSSEDSGDGFGNNFPHLNGEESNLDGKRYEECVYYLQEYARQDLLAFTFRHGHYYDACLLFFPPDSVPPPPLPSPYQPAVVSSSPQRPDSLATDYGSIDDLCEYCVRYGAFQVLERVLSNRSNSQDSAVASHTSASLTRICTYCEAHRHFNHLYRFQVLKKDYVAAGLCCIQLFLNSSHQEEALHHLENARSHFDEGLLARQQAGDMTKGSAKASRGKLPSDKLSEEELIKFTPRINIQMEVVRTFGEAEGPLWKRSLFGNPNDADTSKRRNDVAEALVEKNVHLAFQMINDFGLTAVHIYAGVAASLAERRKTRDLTELLGNIKGTIHDDDWDQVLGAAINVYASRRRERPDQLIDMLKSTHRKVLAYVVCGRLKSAYQKASESGSFADVQYVAHQARQSGSKSVLELCQQWLAKNSS